MVQNEKLTNELFFLNGSKDTDESFKQTNLQKSERMQTDYLHMDEEDQTSEWRVVRMISIQLPK